MSNEVVTNQDFQTRMFERIRGQLGDMMTDDDLKRIVEAAVQKSFFEGRIERRQYGNDVHHPPLFVELVAKEVRPAVERAAADWVEANKEQVIAAIKGAISEGGYGLVQSHINSMLAPGIFAMQQAMRDKGFNV